jgi:hypothetical protein
MGIDAWRGFHQPDGVLDHWLHAFLCLFGRAAIVDIEQIKKEKPGLGSIELINIHSLDLRLAMWTNVMRSRIL